MTDTSREAVERLLDGVTPGKWVVGEDQCVDDTWSIVTTSGGAVLANVNDRPARTANARFIAAARELVPALLARAEAAEADLRASKISEVFWRDGWHALDQDKRAIEAKLAIAVEALREIEAAGKTLETPSDYARGWNHGRFRARELARAALAEIKEKDDE